MHLADNDASTAQKNVIQENPDFIKTKAKKKTVKFETMVSFFFFILINDFAQWPLNSTPASRCTKFLNHRLNKPGKTNNSWFCFLGSGKVREEHSVTRAADWREEDSGDGGKQLQVLTDGTQNWNSQTLNPNFCIFKQKRLLCFLTGFSGVFMH